MHDPRRSKTHVWSRMVAVVCWAALGASEQPPSTPAGGVVGATRELVFTGSCDASAAVPLTDRLFVVADDEDNVLRIYDADRGGAPLEAVDVSPFLGLDETQRKTEKKRRKTRKQHHGDSQEDGPKTRKAAEADLEAAARLGDLAFWMTSHARKRSGEPDDARLLFFATTAPTGGGMTRPVGKTYDGLLQDLVADARFARFDLAAAARLPPKRPGALNIEALGARPEGGLLIGFRNPNPDGKALLIPLLNPERLIEGEAAEFGAPILLDLGGLGVRSLGWWRGRYLVVAGHRSDGVKSRLYTWDGAGAASPVPGVDFVAFNPEALFSPRERDEVLVLSDDGSEPVDGRECKRLKDPERKRFRGAWLGLPHPR